MKAYRHILLTTDFSKFSETVAKKAINLAGHFNAEITVLHVVEQSADGRAGDRLAPRAAESDQQLIAEDCHRLDDFIRSVPNFRAIPLSRLSAVSVEDEIIKVAKEIKANLIIIGTPAKARISVLPSLSVEAFKGKAPCDVLVVSD